METAYHGLVSVLITRDKPLGNPVLPDPLMRAQSEKMLGMPSDNGQSMLRLVRTGTEVCQPFFETRRHHLA